MSGIRSLRRGSTIQGYASGSSAPIYVDADDNKIKCIPAGSGTAEVQFVDSATGGGISFSGMSPTTHVINFTGITLADSSNLIRGTAVAPTRTSGWISLSGTVGATPAQVYSDYRELHTNGVAQVLGIGSFPFMDSGSSCPSLFAGQFISEVDTGATVTTASAAPLVGVYAIVAKTLIDNATVNSGAQLGAIALSVQVNTTVVSGEASCVAYLEVASGLLRDIFYLNATGGVLATNLFRFSAATSPLTTGGAGTPTAAAGTWYNLRCSINGTAAYIPISTAAWTNA